MLNEVKHLGAINRRVLSRDASQAQHDTPVKLARIPRCVVVCGGRPASDLAASLTPHGRSPYGIAQRADAIGVLLPKDGQMCRVQAFPHGAELGIADLPR